MTLTTRKPTGKPPWPILLLAGTEKSGKSYAAAAASASPLIGRTFWVGVGEDDPDEYGAIPGARFEIVLHDGTYRGILNAIRAAVDEPRTNDLPNLIVLDSAGRVWALLSDQAQATANERAARRNKKVGDDGAQITMDLWNLAKQRWNHILDVLREHDGPVVLTARLDRVSVMNDSGEPTKEKEWKVQAEKNLPFEAGVVVHFRSYGEACLTGVRSLKFRPKPNELTPLPDFAIEALWTSLGLAEKDATTPRQHSGADPRDPATLLAEVAAAADAVGVSRQTIADEWAESHEGEPISKATDIGGLELLRDDLRTRAANQQEASDAA